MLAAGRNWHALQQSFSIGVLALVPTGSESGIQNSECVHLLTARHVADSFRIERIPAAVFDAFLNLLAEYRGGFIESVSSAVSGRIPDILYRRDLQSKYRFETIDANVLRAHTLDALVLVDLCGTE
jgi:hypothetical protein